jgi:CubicO group peptidase (beta-lactamase class C family)
MRRNSWTISILPLACLLALSGLAPMRTAQTVVADDVRSGALGTPGAAIAVVQGGKVTTLQFLGAADAARGRPVSATSAYRIASITKMFTAVSIMQLIERGRLHLDDRLDRYLPWAPHSGDVTIEQLLTHSSGIPDFWDLAVARHWTARAVTPREIVETISHRPLAFKPGSSSAYSNTEYTLLGLVVERVSAMPLSAYEKAHIFVPAHMMQTAQGRAAPGTTLAAPSGSDLTAFDPSWWYGSGDLVSTAADLARFDIALFEGTIVTPKTFEQMQRVGMVQYGHGLGLDSIRFSSKTLFGRPGGIPGYGSIDMFVPADRNAVVALGGGDFDWGGVLVPLFTQLYPTSLEERGDTTPVPSRYSSVIENFTAGLQKGQITRSVLSPQLNELFTAPVLHQVAQQFTSFGALRRLVFIKRDRNGGYEYDELFDYACYPWTFGFDRRGKLTAQ